MEAQHRPHEELQPSNLEASVAVMAVEMRYVRAGIEELKQGQQQTSAPMLGQGTRLEVRT